MQDYVFEDLESLPASRSAFPFEQCFVDIPSPGDAQFVNRGSPAFDVDSYLQLDNGSCPLWSADSYETPFSDGMERTSFLTGASQDHCSNREEIGSSLVHSQDHPWLDTTEEYLQLVPRLFRSGYCRSEAHLFSTADQTEQRTFFVPASGSPHAASQSRKSMKTTEDSSEKCGVVPNEAQQSKLKGRSGAEKSKQGEVPSFLTKETVLRTRMSTRIYERKTESEPQKSGPVTPPSSISDVPILSRKRKGLTRKEAAKAEETVLAPTSPNLPSKKASSALKSSSAASSGKLPEILSAKTNSTKAIDEKAEEACGSCKNERPAETRTAEPARPKKGPRRNPQKRLHPKESVQVLVDWTQSSSVVAYPDKEAKQQLAEAAHLTIQQVDSWLAVQRNRTGLIKVPDTLRKRSRTKILQAPRGLQGNLENEE